MTTIQIQTELSFETLLSSLQQLDTVQLDQLALETSLVRARRIAPSLTDEETALLQAIQNSHIPSEMQQRCGELSAKQRETHLTDPEQQELATLIDHIEIINAQRIAYLIALAELRHLSLDEVITQLEIKPFSYE
jgi:hypothetical protein